MNQVYLRQPFKLASDEKGILKREIDGVAYSGAVIPSYGFMDNLVIDLATLKVAKAKTPILRDHNQSQVAGSGKAFIQDNQVLIQGRLSEKSPHANEIVDLANDDFDWEMSVGIFDGDIEEFTNKEFNGQQIEHGFVLTNGLLREVSIVALGADMNTSAEFFSIKKGESYMLSKEQWIKFACGCGGSDKSTPEELEQKFAASDEKVSELEKEIADLKSELADKQAALDKIKEEGDVSAREGDIAAAVAAKNLNFAPEKIKKAAASKESTELFLSMVEDMEAAPKKVDPKFAGKVVVTPEGGGSSKDETESIRMKANAMVKAGEAENFLEAISLLEAK